MDNADGAWVSKSAGINFSNDFVMYAAMARNNIGVIYLGGLIKRTSGVRRSGVPVLGDVPMLGRLFSSQEDTFATTETVVVITPRIVSGAAQTQLAVPAEALKPVASPLGQGSLRLDMAEPTF